MNGLTATGVTVGICAGLWQLVSSHVGLSQGWCGRFSPRWLPVGWPR